MARGLPEAALPKCAAWMQELGDVEVFSKDWRLYEIVNAWKRHTMKHMFDCRF